MADSVTTPTAVTQADSASELCACGHPLATHDRIAARFCRATIDGVLPRSCICRKV